MNFQDTWVTDDEGNKWVFTVEMQRKLHQAGLPVEPSALDDLRRPPTVTYVTDEPGRKTSGGRTPGAGDDPDRPGDREVSGPAEMVQPVPRLRIYRPRRG